MKATNSVKRQALSIKEVCEEARVGKSSIYLAIKQRKLRARKIGARTIILRTEFEEYLASLPSNGLNDNAKSGGLTVRTTGALYGLQFQG